MIVFCVFRHIRYEGSSLLRIFATKDSAIKFTEFHVAKCTNDITRYERDGDDWIEFHNVTDYPSFKNEREFNEMVDRERAKPGTFPSHWEEGDGKFSVEETTVNE